MKIQSGRVIMIKTVIRVRNDMVMVFDNKGEQIPEYQGYYEDVKEKILADAPEGTLFNHWFSRTLDPEVVTGESW
jgi:hypothetical protein